MNTDCYTYKEVVFEKGILDHCLDATYIIHLEGNGRLDHVYQQLERYHPTKLVTIVFNKGYKKTGKKLPQNTPSHDLVDAFLTVFKDANEKKYNNILILEDDFIFSEKILDVKNTDSISHFIHAKNKERKEFVYALGCLPWFQIPIEFYTRRVIIRTGTHACIYSKEVREKILTVDQSTINDWDIYTNLSFQNYMFYEPLCYQLFPETENKKHWFYFFGLSELFNGLLQFFRLDEKVEPGFSFFYWSSLLFFVFIVMIVYFIIDFYVGYSKISWFF